MWKHPDLQTLVLYGIILIVTTKIKLLMSKCNNGNSLRLFSVYIHSYVFVYLLYFFFFRTCMHLETSPVSFLRNGIPRRSRPMPFVLRSAFSFSFLDMQIYFYLCVKFDVSSPPLGASLSDEENEFPRLGNEKQNLEGYRRSAGDRCEQ